ncbi:MAG TPA: DUF5667 domain-containing protein [Actinomycetota bacterium]|nr:DUF5667 domain-containing protein [Actinomycetota bacterium]
MGEDLALALALEGRLSAARGETVKLVALAGVLAKLPEPEIDASFADALEARLLTDGLPQAATPRLQLVSIPATPADEVVRTAAVITMPRRRMVVRKSVAAFAAAAMLSAFPVAASASSVPGSPFYGLKRGIERIELKMFGTPEEDAFKLAVLANRRIDEASVVHGADTREDLIAEATANLKTGEALILGNVTDPATIARFSHAVRETEQRMEGMSGEASTATQDALDDAIWTTKGIRRALAAAIAGAGITIEPAANVKVQAAQGQPAAPDATAPGTKGGSARDDADVRKGARKNVNDTTDKDPTGNGKNVRGTTEECRAPGSANGLGFITEPAAGAVCQTWHDAFTPLDLGL